MRSRMLYSTKGFGLFTRISGRRHQVSFKNMRLPGGEQFVNTRRPWQAGRGRDESRTDSFVLGERS